MNNKKRNKYNIIFSILSQGVIIIFGLIVPRIILIHYGSGTNGLLSTITQIFTYMALLEAGIGQATKNALYPEIESHNNDKISLIMSASRKYFHKITLVYMLAVITLSIILPFVLKSPLDYWTIFFIVLFEGFTGVVSFFFIESWNVLLLADGKNYINSIFDLASKLLCYGIKIILAILVVNVALIQVGFFLASLIKLFFYYLYIGKHYKFINYNIPLNGYKLQYRNSYVITEIAWTVFSSTDMIILSIFCSTQLSSVYSVYSLIYVSLSGLLNAVFQGLHFNLSQTYFNDLERYKKLHNLFNSLFMGAITILMCTSYWLTIPFVKLYTAGIEDINYIYPYLPILFCIVQILSWSRFVPGNLTGIAGYAKQISVVSIIEAVINVGLSILLVFFFDIQGVLIATVIALPLKVVYANYLAEIKILKRKPWKTMEILFVNYLIFAGSVVVGQFVTLTVSNYWYFILYGFVFVTGYIILVFGLNVLVNKDLLLAPKIINGNKAQNIM